MLAKRRDIFLHAKYTILLYGSILLGVGYTILLEDKMPISVITDGKNTLGYILPLQGDLLEAFSFLLHITSYQWCRSKSIARGALFFYASL